MTEPRDASTVLPEGQPGPATDISALQTLLSSKYQLPSARAGLVARRRLTDKLNLGAQRRLILISAPPGFGKTTLLAEWLAGYEPHTLPRRVAWVSLDETDNDPAQLLHYLIAALQQIDAHIGVTAHEFMHAPQMPPISALLVSLVSDITNAHLELYLALDDYHCITNPAAHKITSFLLEHLPSTAHLVIATREDPPLPLARLRARSESVEIRERDLRFMRDEAATFLSETMGLSLAASSLDLLATRTEGWVAGLQLGALVLQEGAESGSADKLAATFTGNDRYVIDYLMSEVLDHQAESVRNFLIQTSTLEQLTAQLCDAVTGRVDSRALLEQLEQKNLFLIPLDHRREWYRYYRLFREFLRTQLNPTELATLHQKATSWYEAHGLKSEAIQHALAYARACGNWEPATRLIRDAAEEQFQSGAVTALRTWLDALPDSLIDHDGELATYRAWAGVVGGDMTRAERDTAAATQALGDAPSPVLGKLLTLQAVMAMGHQDHEQVIQLAQRALEMLGDREQRWRTITLWELAEAQERTRPIEQAIASLRRIRADLRTQGNYLFAPAIDAFLASALNNQGQRREAIAICEQRLARQASGAGLPPVLSVMVITHLAQFFWEGNQLDLAEEYARQAVAAAEQLGSPDLIVFALGCMALVANARGQSDRALTLMQQVETLTAFEAFSDSSWLRACQAQIHLQRGEIDAVAWWVESEGLQPESEPTFLHMDALLMLARFLIAQDQLPEARNLLKRLESFVEERGLRRYQINVHLLQAWAAEQNGEAGAAREYAVRSLKIAVPEGYVRPFMDEDAHLRPVLASLRYVAPEFIDQVLALPGGAAVETNRLISQRAQALVEPLTERELEILRLIDAGLANAEIAHRLVIATGTVKRHLNNLYGKLGVESRTQAIARGRELGLI
jgi:LuxR family maltose regulon positive regulatory protein